MRIVFCLPHLKLSGGVRVILTYANELYKLRHRVTILVNEKSRRNLWFKNFFGFNLKWFPLSSDIRVYCVNERTFNKLLTNIQPDVIVADSYNIAKWFIGLPFKIVQTIQHDERLYHGDSSEVGKVYAVPLEKIVVSTWLQEMLKRDFNQSSHLLINSFDHELFKPIPDAKVNDGKVRVLVLDHPYEWKGTKEAVKMIRELQNKHPQVVLMGFGARANQASKNFDEFYYQPTQSDLARIYSRADIFLCPSWDEGFGLPSLEAMACGTAVVTYDNGGSRDFAKDGETALVSPRQNQRELKKKLEQLINDKELRQKLVQNSLALIESWPTWSEQANKLEKILENGITL